MAFSVKKTEIEGVLVIHPHIFEDERGAYKKCYEKNFFNEIGICAQFTESSDLYSVKGALRGLHYQERYSQAKLVHVVLGVVYDVALDLRKDSKTFGRYHAEILKGDENKIIYIPEGFAHGFITLSNEAIFSYQCTGQYDPESCGGIRWDDKDLAINWPLKDYNVSEVICTEKDKTWPTFEEYCKGKEE